MFIDTSQHYEEPVVASAFNVWVDIHAPMETVFRFLTDERELTRWWASGCTAEPRPGGRLHFVWRDENTEITGDALFLRFEPPSHLVIQWTHQNGEPVETHGDGQRGMRWPALNIYNLTQINANTTRVYLHDLGISSDSKFQELRGATRDGWMRSMNRLKRGIEERQREAMTQQLRKAKRERAARKVTEAQLPLNVEDNNVS